MKINRQTFLDDLQMVRAGLSPKEFIEQSSCFVFQDGAVMTFNDEIACRKEIGGELSGAVPADSLLAILEKLTDPDLKVVENEKGELEFRGKKKRFWLNRTAEIFLPIDRVETPEKWREVPDKFAEAIKAVRPCICTDETQFILTCVHLHPEYVEACNNKELLRWHIGTGLKRSILVRGSALAQIIDLGMTEMAGTKSWLHFRNPKGLMFSCRKYMEDYPNLDHILEFKGEPIVLPKTLVEVAERATVFATESSGDPLLIVTLTPGIMRILGSGISGGYEEIKKINYHGTSLKFVISPDTLGRVSATYTDAQISKNKLKAIEKGKWEYVTVLGRTEDHVKEEKEKPEEDETSEDYDPTAKDNQEDDVPF